MRKYIYLIILLMLIAAMPASTSLYAQSAKTHLDIKPKATTTVKNKSLRIPFFKAALSDRLVVNRSTAINQFYRSILTSPQSTKSKSPESIANNPTLHQEVKTGEEAFQTGGEKLFSNDKITISNIYPNPANEFATVDYVLSASVNEAKLVFINVLGSQVSEYELEKSERRLTIRTVDLNNGIYFYQLYVDGKSLATKKLLVRHQ